MSAASQPHSKTDRQPGAVIVSYHPDLAIVQNARTLAADGTSVVVVDNNSGPSATSILEELQTITGVIVVKLHDNAGLAKALNTGIATLDSGCEHIFLFDQDSVAPPGFVDAMVTEWHTLCSRGANVGVLGPAYFDDNAQRLLNRDLADEPIERTVLFTSGLLVPRSVLDRIGPFREDFFVDYVDSDFCLRCRRAGLRNFQTPNVVLRHSLGRTTVHHRFGRDLRTTNHSPLRRMWMTRNRIILWAEHGRVDRTWLLRNEWPSAFGDLIKIIVLEQEKTAKLRAMATGVAQAVSTLRSKHRTAAERTSL